MTRVATGWALRTQAAISQARQQTRRRRIAVLGHDLYGSDVVEGQRPSGEKHPRRVRVL